MQNKQLELDRITDKIVSCVNCQLQNAQNVAAQLASRIDALSPLKVMARGFSVITKNSMCVSGVADLKVGDNITATLKDGNVDCLITSINK